MPKPWRLEVWHEEIKIWMDLGCSFYFKVDAQAASKSWGQKFQKVFRVVRRPA